MYLWRSDIVYLTDRMTQELLYYVRKAQKMLMYP